MAGGSVHIPWYATGFRGDKLQEALEAIAPIALRYGATSFQVFRQREDRYKFLQTATFHDKMDWERYWHGEEFTRFRAVNSGFYQVPVLYSWADIVTEGSGPRAEHAGAGPSGTVAIDAV